MPSRPPDLAAALRAWLADGELLGPDGAVHAWYDAGRDERAFAYPEITGYALTHFAGPAEPSETEQSAAKGAARWLLQRLDAGNLAARDGWEDGGVYYFDLAMIANGLFTAADRLGLDDARPAAERLVAAMAAEVESVGHLPALPSGQTTTRTGWSVTGTAHMGKALQCLLQGSAPDTVVAAVLEQTLDAQQPDGRFRTDEADEVTMLHPHLYAVEGLWCHAQATGDPRAAAAAQAGAEWVWQHQLPTGGLPRFVPADGRGEPGPEQLDLTAQAVRAAVLTGTSSARSEQAADRLASLAVDRGHGRAALPYQPDAAELHLNAWVTLFAVQALELSAGASLPAWQLLV